MKSTKNINCQKKFFITQWDSKKYCGGGGGGGIFPADKTPVQLQPSIESERALLPSVFTVTHTHTHTQGFCLGVKSFPV